MSLTDKWDPVSWARYPIIWCKCKSITIINKINLVLSSRCARTNCEMIMTRISGIARHTLLCWTTNPAKSSDILEAWCSTSVSNTSVTPACQDLDWYFYCFSLWKGLGSLPTAVAALQFTFRLHVHNANRFPYESSFPSSFHTHPDLVYHSFITAIFPLRKKVGLSLGLIKAHPINRMGGCRCVYIQ
jgi:hypothetical protein